MIYDEVVNLTKKQMRALMRQPAPTNVLSFEMSPEMRRRVRRGRFGQLRRKLYRAVKL